MPSEGRASAIPTGQRPTAKGGEDETAVAGREECGGGCQSTGGRGEEVPGALVAEDLEGAQCGTEGEAEDEVSPRPGS